MYKNRTIAIVSPLVAAAVLTIGILIGLGIDRSNNLLRLKGEGLKTTNNKLTYTLSLIEKMYVDPVNMDSISEHMIPLLVEELDPHSIYLPVSTVAEANEKLDGEFDGIGVLFNMATDTIVVLNVIPSGPSAKAGVLNGDRIIKINDSIVAGKKISQDDVVKKLRGKRGTKVKLGLQRTGIKDLVPVTVTRGVIPIKSIDAAFMIEPGCAFLKLSAFSKNSHAEMVEALDRLKSEGMKRLVFDLRGNGGGFLDQAIHIANEFLPDGDMIVYTLDRNKKRTEEYSKGGQYPNLPLAILIDEGSASSSEILAGAIQDNDRGILVGRRSFGKGLVQNQLFYKDGSALRLTIARYYTPTGRSIQKPYDKGVKEYENDMLNRMNHSEFFSADSIKFADSLKFKTPKGRVVYGGGGIMPDLFIPWDTSDMTHYYREAWGRNILFRYTLEYSDRHRDRINAATTLPKLQAFLDSDKKLFDDFISYAALHGLTPDRKQIERSRALITAQLRAYIARNSPMEDAGFYMNIYPIDKELQRAVGSIRD